MLYFVIELLRLLIREKCKEREREKPMCTNTQVHVRQFSGKCRNVVVLTHGVLASLHTISIVLR